MACEPHKLETGVLLGVSHRARSRACLQSTADILAGHFIWGPFVVWPELLGN